RRARSADDAVAARLVPAVSDQPSVRPDATRGPADRRAADVGTRRRHPGGRRPRALRGVAARVGPPRPLQAIGSGEFDIMRTVSRRTAAAIWAASLISVAVGCNRGQDTAGGGAAAPRGGVPGAAPAIRLVADVSRGEWRMPAGDYGSLRYSTLDRINTANVAHLQVVTT